MRNGLRLFVTAALTAVFATGCGVQYGPALEREVASCAPVRAASNERGSPGGPVVAQAVGPDTVGWLELGSQLELAFGEQPASAGERAYEPWTTRRGPAYKGDFWHSFGRDVKELPLTLWDDTKATFTDPVVWVAFGLAGAAGIAINAAGTDDDVANHFTENRPQLSHFGDMVGDIGGNPGVHFALAGAMYFTSLAAEDERNYEISKAMLNALAINGLATLALKGLVRTRSPNGDPFGWPSGHTSSTFTLATVLHEAYGPWVGVPMFAFAAFVGYERIDARNHDFSDVVSGALIGIAIGHAVMRNHKPKVLGFEIVPWADPNTGAVGLALTKDF